MLFRRFTSPEERFWTWFSANAPKLAAAPMGSPIWTRRITKVLKRYDQQLAWEIDASKKSPLDFVISADGSRQVAPAVERLVAAAPPIPGWRFVAFRQRSVEDVLLEVGGIQLDPRSLLFSAELSPRGTLALKFWVNGINDLSR